LLIPTEEESHDTEQLWLVAITTSFTQGFPHEVPQLLANEETSQTSNPYCDEEEIQGPLLSAGFLDITEPINHTSHQVINILYISMNIICLSKVLIHINVVTNEWLNVAVVWFL